MRQNPFTIRDATFYLYRTDSSDNITSQVYIGPAEERGLYGECVAETASFDATFESKKLEYHGDPDWIQRHVGREYSVELKLVWAHEQEDDGTSQMPGGYELNTSYCLVVLWYDPELSIWVKRTYYKCRSAGQRLEDSFHTLRFTAPRLVEDQGAGLSDGAPTPISNKGTVVFISDDEQILLFTWDRTAGFVAQAETLGRAAITTGSGFLEIRFTGTLALRATTSGVTIGELIAIGGTFVDETPRLEFYMGATRLASLAADGTFAVIDVRESSIDPGAHSGLRLADSANAWLGTFAVPKSTFPGIIES